MDISEPPDLKNVVEEDETYVGGKVGNMSRGRRKKRQQSGKDNSRKIKDADRFRMAISNVEGRMSMIN
jgi:hypothetical protein